MKIMFHNLNNFIMFMFKKITVFQFIYKIELCTALLGCSVSLNHRMRHYMIWLYHELPPPHETLRYSTAALHATNLQDTLILRCIRALSRFKHFFSSSITFVKQGLKVYKEIYIFKDHWFYIFSLKQMLLSKLTWSVEG